MTDGTANISKPNSDTSLKKPIILIVGDGHSNEVVLSILSVLIDKFPSVKRFHIESKIHLGSAKDFLQSHKRLHTLIISRLESESTELAMMVRAQEKRDTKNGNAANIIVIVDSHVASGAAASFARFHVVILKNPLHWQDLNENLADMSP